MNVIVYTKPSCVQCDATKRSLDKLNVDKGFKSMPVVNAGDQWWSGFNPDKINGLVD
jgi:glutaredoxin-like protein NrdH